MGRSVREQREILCLIDLNGVKMVAIDAGCTTGTKVSPPSLEVQQWSHTVAFPRFLLALAGLAFSVQIPPVFRKPPSSRSMDGPDAVSSVALIPTVSYLQPVEHPAGWKVPVSRRTTSQTSLLSVYQQITAMRG